MRFLLFFATFPCPTTWATHNLHRAKVYLKRLRLPDDDYMDHVLAMPFMFLIEVGTESAEAPKPG